MAKYVTLSNSEKDFRKAMKLMKQGYEDVSEEFPHPKGYSVFRKE